MHTHNAGRIQIHGVKVRRRDQEVILINANEGTVMKNVPNDWKTKKAAIRWAINNGYEISQTPEMSENHDDEKIIELTERISKLEEKLQTYEDAFQLLKKVFKMVDAA